MPDALKILTIPQICKRYKISSSTISRLVKQGLIPESFKRQSKNGRWTQYWPAIDFDLWVAEQEDRKPLPLESSQADRLINAFGGVLRLARLLDINSSVIYRWRVPRDYGGTGGYVPNTNWQLIRIAAKEQRVKLTPELTCP